MKAFYLCAAMVPLWLAGCAQKVHVRSLAPAEIARAAKTKKIAVTPFRHDVVGLAGKVEAELSRRRIDGKPYFTVVSRMDLDKILAEQRHQNSGLLNPDDAVEVGHLIGAEAIVSGEVGAPSIQDTRFYETRTRCKNDHCYEYKVSCVKRTAGLSAQIRMVDVKQGDIIYADTLSDHAEWEHCNDDSKGMPSRQMAADYLAGVIAKRFVYKLTPHYVTFDVPLLEDPDIDYTDEQEHLLEYGLRYVEQKRYDKAEELFRRLLESTGERSYVPFYNLGVLYEMRGNYREAQNYYRAADKLTVEPVDSINAAVVRIQRLIAKSEEAHSQIAAGR